MFKKKKQINNPFVLDSFGSRKRILNETSRANSIYSKSITANIATLLFVLIDFVVLYSSWNAVQTENPYMIRLITLGCAICLDVPLAAAGVVFVTYKQKLRDKNSTIMIMTLSILTFVITFLFSFWFRMELKDLLFDVQGTGNMTNTLATDTMVDNSGNGVLVAALFNAIIPLCTSIASFVISYIANDSIDPINVQLRKINGAIIEIDARIAKLDQACFETDKIDEYNKVLVAGQFDLYQQFVSECSAECITWQQAAKVAIMEKLSADGISIMSEDGEKLNADFENALNEKAYEPTLLQEI